MDSEIEKLKQEEKRAEARLKRKREAVRQAQRKRDTQRKVIVGAAALKLAESDPALAARIEAELNERDRKRVGPLVIDDNQAQKAPGQSDPHPEAADQRPAPEQPANPWQERVKTPLNGHGTE